MLKKLGKNSTTKLYYTWDGVRTECTDKVSMEEACIAENTARFSQKEASPPMTEPLVSNLGYLADTETAQRILDGTYEIPADLDPYAALLIQELRMSDSIRNSPPCPQGWKPRTIFKAGLNKKRPSQPTQMA